MSLPALSRSRLLLACLSTAALVVAIACPGLLGDRFTAGIEGLGSADPRYLWAAGGSLATMHLLGALAWCIALRACNSPVCWGDGVARYSVGSGLNAVAPAHLGSAARIALLSRVGGEGGVWCVGGAGVAVGAVRSLWSGGLVLLAVLSGAMPLWPMLVTVGVLAGLVGAVVASRRVAARSRLGFTLRAFRELGRQPRALAWVGLATLASVLAKIGGAALVAASLGIDHPLRAALLVVPAVELAAVMPITPGNAGLASAAVAIALGAHGVGRDTALAAGIAFGAVELLAALTVGALGVAALTRPHVRPARWVAAAGIAVSLATVGVVSTVVASLV